MWQDYRALPLVLQIAFQMLFLMQPGSSLPSDLMLEPSDASYKESPEPPPLLALSMLCSPQVCQLRMLTALPTHPSISIPDLREGREAWRMDVKEGGMERVGLGR